MIWVYPRPEKSVATRALRSEIRPQPFSEILSRLVQIDEDIILRAADDLSGFPNRMAFDIAQNENGFLSRLQSRRHLCQRASQLGAFRFVLRIAMRAERRHGLLIVTDKEQAPAFALAQAVDAEIDHDSGQQGRDGVLIRLTVFLLPESDKGLLRLVTRIFEIAEQVTGQSDDSPLMAIDDLFKIAGDNDCGWRHSAFRGGR